MNFELTEDQELIRRSVAELARKFDDHYWLEKDQDHQFPTEFYRAIADGGWLGMTIPTEFGGHGLGITSDRPGDIVESNQRVLESGMVFVMHPNQYIPESGYLMCGEPVVITPTGARSLSARPATLDVIAV